MSATIIAAMKEVLANPDAEGLARIQKMIEDWEELRESEGWNPYRYHLTAYRPDSVETCRGCVVDRSGSDFQIIAHDDEYQFIRGWANLIHFDMTSGREYAGYEYYLDIDGIRYDNGGNHPLYTKAKAIAEDMERVKKEEKEERERLSRIAAEESKIQQEKAQLAALLAKYGNPASI